MKLTAMKSTFVKVGRIVLLCLCGAYAVHAQEITGTISGSVSDQTGAYIAGAKLTLTDVATGVARNTVTQPSGAYSFDYIDPGTYSLKAEAAGFDIVVVNSIKAEVAHTTTTDIHLQVGRATQLVTVSAADRPQIDTVNAEVSTNIPEDFIQQLGSSSRDALSYASLSAGVTIVQSAAGAANSLCISCGDVANINGSWNERTNYYLDGIDNFGNFRNLSLQFPSPDAIQTVSVSSSNTPAEYGAQMGGAINVVTKSGTNQFHGDAFFFFSPEALSANDAGNKFYGLPKVPNNLREVGGTLGGPIIRNKTLFFLSYQRYSNSIAGLQDSVRPGTPAMMQGDFGELLTPTAASGLSPVQLYDPNYPGQTQPIPNNDLETYVSPKTSASLINPVGLNLAKLMPTVSNYGDQYIWSFTDPQTNDELLLKIDQSIGKNQHLAVSFFGVNGNQILPAMEDNFQNVPDYGPEVDTANQISMAVHYSWTPSSSLLVAPFFSMGFANADRGDSKVGQNLSTLGATNVPITALGARLYLPNLSFNGMTASDGWLSDFDQHNYVFGSAVTMLHNKHEMKFGFSMQHERIYQYNDQDQGGITFNGQFATGLYGVGSVNDTGSSLADMLMGYSEGFSQTGILLENDSNWNNAFYAQDQWKITPRFTLTPGIRYDLYLPSTEANNKMSLFKPGYQSTLYPNAYLGMAFPGDPGIPKGLYSTDFGDIAPRLGVAWDVKGDGRTAIRGGLGWFFSSNAKQDSMEYSEANPWLPTAACQATIISDPWLDCQRPSYAAPPTPFSVTPAALKAVNWQQTFGSITGTGIASDFKNPYSIQWSITVEHQFAHNITLSTAYVGNHGFRLPAAIPLNWAVYDSTASLEPANISSRQPYSNGLYAGNNGAGLYNSSTREQASAAEYYYNGWQTTFAMHPIKSLELRANYEWAHGQTNDITNDIACCTISSLGNPAEPFASWGNYEARDVFKAYYLWEVPFHPTNRLLNSVAGGWHFSGDVHAISGSPVNIELGYDWEYDGLGTTGPSLNGPIQYSRTKSPQGFIQYLNIGSTSGQPGLANGAPISQRGSWTLPGGGTDHSVYGNAQLNDVWGPGTWSADTTLLKDFHVTESQYAEFRMEGFNIFNHEVHGCLDATYTDTQFGQLTCNSGARTVQLGLKYYF